MKLTDFVGNKNINDDFISFNAVPKAGAEMKKIVIDEVRTFGGSINKDWFVLGISEKKSDDRKSIVATQINVVEWDVALSLAKSGNLEMLKAQETMAIEVPGRIDDDEDSLIDQHLRISGNYSVGLRVRAKSMNGSNVWTYDKFVIRLDDKHGYELVDFDESEMG